MNRLSAIAATFWIGGLWTVGLLVTPVLFKTLSASNLASIEVAHIFAIQAWVGLVCGVILLIDALWSDGLHGMRGLLFWLVIGMLLCTLINHFAVTPILSDLKRRMNNVAQGMFGGGFATWQAISSLIYLSQSLLGLLYLLKKNS